MLSGLFLLAIGAPTAWSGELQEALHRYYLIENFDERIADDGFIDTEVLDFMRGQAGGLG